MAAGCWSWLYYISLVVGITVLSSEILIGGFHMYSAIVCRIKPVLLV
jgi:hypothetical protein